MVWDKTLLESLPPRVSRFPFDWAARTPEAAAYIEGERVWTYRELALAIQQGASFLKAEGMRPGDRLLVVNENCVQAIVFILAAQELDAWPVPVSARLTSAELDAIETHCDPRLILYASTASPEAAAHARAKGAQARSNGPLGTFHLSGLYGKSVPEEVHADPARQVAALLYTTGTTGKPKAVMLSHRNLQYNVCVGALVRGVTASDRLYGSLPISHVYGLASMALLTLYTGASARIIRRHSPDILLEALERGGVTVLQAVPAMYAGLLKQLSAKKQERIVHRLRYIQSGGSPLALELKRRTEALLGLPLHNSYGLTETSPTLVMTRIESPRADDAVGEALPGVEIRLTDENGQRVPAGLPGEMQARGPNVMLGYFKDPAATGEALIAGGWFRTGDLAVRLPDGAFQVVGRAKEVIIRSGFNVHPAEVEAALSAHPEVSQSAVVGRASRDGNEEPVAFVELVAGSQLGESALRDFLLERLAPYKRPARYVFLAALPASPTGKVLRKALRDMAQALKP